MDRIESTMAEGFRQFHAAMAEGFRLSHGGINRPEEKVDAIEAFLRQGRLPVGVEGGESTPAPAAKPGGFSAAPSWPVLRDR